MSTSNPVETKDNENVKEGYHYDGCTSILEDKEQLLMELYL